jgi:hypothetical protein
MADLEIAGVICAMPDRVQDFISRAIPKPGFPD